MKTISRSLLSQKTNVESGNWVSKSRMGDDAIVPFDTITHVRNYLKIEKAVRKIVPMFIRNRGSGYFFMERANQSHFDCAIKLGAPIALFCNQGE